MPTTCFIDIPATLPRIQFHIRSITAEKIIRHIENALTTERVHYTYRQLNQTSLQLYKLHLELSKILYEDFRKTVDKINYEHQEQHFNMLKFDKLKPTGPTHNGNWKSANRHQPVHVTIITETTQILKEEKITHVECAIRRLLAEVVEDIRHETCRVPQKGKPPTKNITNAIIYRLRIADLVRNLKVNTSYILSRTNSFQYLSI